MACFIIFTSSIPVITRCISHYYSFSIKVNAGDWGISYCIIIIFYPLKPLESSSFIFIPNGYAHSFAELGDATKNEISHRSLAVRSMCQELQGLDIQST